MDARLYLVRSALKPPGTALVAAAGALASDPAVQLESLDHDQILDRLSERGSSERAVVVVLDDAVPQVVRFARSINRLHPKLYLIFVTEPYDEAQLRESLRYGAPAGGRWSIVTANAEALNREVAQTLRTAIQQSRFRATVGHVVEQMKRLQDSPRPAFHRLIASDHYLANLMRNAHDAIVSLSAEGEIVSWNQAAETLFDRKEIDVLGRPFSELFLNATAIEQMLDKALGKEPVRRDLVTKGEGELATVADAVFAWIEDNEGTPLGVLVTMREVTVQRRLERMAREADLRKDEFLAMLAHELRNPLAPITNQAELISRLGANDARITHASGVISRQAQHLTGLLNQLLDVSRVTRGLVSIDKSVLLPEDFVSRAVEQVRGMIDVKQQTLSVNYGDGQALVCGDLRRLIQIVGNLVSNASRYTQNDGVIDITVDSTAEDVTLTVRDNGRGIDADLLPHIFELFTQESRTVDRASGGLGIGLAMVKSLVALHEGRVSVQSGGLNHGSTFEVSLPRYYANAAHTGRPIPVPLKTAALSRRVLVVDDNVDAAESLAILLRDEGHEAGVAFSGAQALGLAEKQAFDAFILDIGMPEMDGYTLAARLRAHPLAKQALIIAHTGYGQEEDRQRALKAGFDHHLTKPADLDRLFSMLAIDQDDGND